MAEQNSTLTTFYDAWKEYQDHLRDAIAPLTDAQLAQAAAPGLRTIGQLAAHIIAARVGWFHGFLGEGGEDIAPLADWDVPDAAPRSAAELAQALDRTWAFVADALARWGSAGLDQTFPHEWRGDHYDLSRSWVLWHILEHDLHHGGEISLTLGVHGLPAPDV